MARTRVTTKYEIIQVASAFFLDVGYSATSPKMIAQELGISTGNITYYFPTKEHLLAVIVEMLCDFQWKMLEEEAKRGVNSIGSMCLELMTVAAACEQSKIAKDFFVSTFQSDICRKYLRENHVERAKKIFAASCDGWTDQQYVQAEIQVMGLQYATIVSTDADVSLDVRISGALNQILSIYGIDEQTRKCEIDKVLAMNSYGIGKRVLDEFVKYVNLTSEEALEKAIRGNRRKSLLLADNRV